MWRCNEWRENTPDWPFSDCFHWLLHLIGTTRNSNCLNPTPDFPGGAHKAEYTNKCTKCTASFYSNENRLLAWLTVVHFSFPSGLITVHYCKSCILHCLWSIVSKVSPLFAPTQRIVVEIPTIIFLNLELPKDRSVSSIQALWKDLKSISDIWAVNLQFLVSYDQDSF